jgi:hypothetical protein
MAEENKCLSFEYTNVNDVDRVCHFCTGTSEGVE